MSPRVVTGVAVVLTLWGGAGAAQEAPNTPPRTPVILEPPVNGAVVNGEDVHMATEPFSDPDPGDVHTASDWEIWTTSPSQRVWLAAAVTGPEKLHIHLADGVFQGSHAGRRSLRPSTGYVLRTRHRDSSGQASTQWSQFAERAFSTASVASVLPMEIDDIEELPLPVWRAGGAAVSLPGGASPAFLRVESGIGAALLVITGGAGQNRVLDLPRTASHSPVRVRVSAGGQALSIPPSELVFTDHEGRERTVYLPQIGLGGGQNAYFWVAANGGTFTGVSSQTEPNFSTVARHAPVPWNAPPGFVVDVFATGLQLPVHLAFVPNPGPQLDAPLLYVTELYGKIKVVKRDRSVGTYASGLLNFDPGGAFPGSGEQGVTGIAVDPANGDVIASMLYDAGGPHYPKVVRFRSNDGGRTAASQQIVLDMVGESQGASHQISQLTFGPDGKLYVHVGDGFEAAAALNLDSFRGKILRMNPNGSAPSDNPFYSVVNGINARDYVYAYGVRNPFGGAWRGADGRLYEVENGPGVDRLAQVAAGRNFGWDGSDDSMRNLAAYNWSPPSAPVAMAFVQPSTFGGSRFPSWMQGRAYVTESGSTWSTGPQAVGKAIAEFELDGAGAVVSGPTPVVEYEGAGKATCVGLAAGPDGLYFTDLYKDFGYSSPIDPGANILRLRFMGEAEFTADATAGQSPLTVRFTDQASALSPTAYLWVFGDGGISSQRSPVHTYTREGRYNVRRRVTGINGAVVRQRNDYIRVGNIVQVALICGSIPPNASDLALLDHLAAKGFIVHPFDDEAAVRLGAAGMAAEYNVVLVSASVNATNIAGEFRTVGVPVVFWEQGLLRTGRETLSDNGAEVSGATAISIINTSHPVTQGLAGGTLGVYSAGAAMSVGTGSVAPGATVLARRAGSNDAAVMVAERGATLLGGFVAPERRAFLFMGENGYASTTAAARELVDRAICWAGGLNAAVTQQPASQTVDPGQPATLSVSLVGAGPMRYQWRRNGVPLADGGRITGAGTRVLRISSVAPADDGNYDVVVTAPCNTVVSQAATLRIGCYPNCDGSNGSPRLNILDFLCFQAKFAAGDPYANCDGSTAPPVLRIDDFICFQSKFVTGCP